MTSDNEKKTLNNVFPSPPPFPLVSGHRLFWISWWCYWWAGQWHNESIVGMFLKFTSRVLFLCLAHVVFFLTFLLHKWKYLVSLKKRFLSLSSDSRFLEKPQSFPDVEVWRHTLLSSGIILGITERSHSPLFNACSYSISWPMKLKLGEIMLLFPLTKR